MDHLAVREPSVARLTLHRMSFDSSRREEGERRRAPEDVDLGA
jgi:hypothetical protein